MNTQTAPHKSELYQQILSDTNLSWGAKGLLCHLLKNPSVKHVSVSILMEISKEKRHSAELLLKEVSESRYSKILDLKP